MRDLGLGLAVIRELLRGGALDDPARVHAILAEHADAIRRDIELRRETLTRVERALAVVAREGVAPSAASPGAVVVKQVPELRAVGLRRAVRVREMVALAREVERKLASPPIGPRIHVYYNEEFDPEQVDVEILFPVAEGGERVLPAATVAAVLLVGLDDSAAVGAAYAAVYDWIEAQGRRDVGPPREVLLVGPEHGKRLSEQVIVQRQAQPYMGIKASVAMKDLAAVIPKLIPEVFAWLGAHGLQPAGAPFFRYDVVDMDGQLEMEVGVPVASTLSGDSRVQAGVLPAGRYATLTHTGHPHGLMDANAALQKWAADQGLRWKISDKTWGSRLEIYLTNPEEEPGQERWQTEIAYQLAEG